MDSCPAGVGIIAAWIAAGIWIVRSQAAAIRA